MNRAPEISSRPAHHREGGFQNPWPHATPKGLGSVLKWMLTRSRSESAQEDSTPPQYTPARMTDRAEDLSITWIGHSSFLLQCDGLNILTDPIWSERASPVKFAGPRRLVPPPLALEQLPAIDVTLLSHDHYDHFDDSTVRTLIARFPDMTWCVPLGVAQMVEDRGASNVIEMDWWETRDLRRFRIACTPAQHFSGRYPWKRNTTLWCGWTLEFANATVYFAGDTALHPEFAKIAEAFGPFDLSILPIGAYEPRWFMRTVHMTPEDTVSAFREIIAASPKPGQVMVASHWGTFRLTDEPVMEPPALTRELWSGAGLPSESLWILSHGETRTLRTG